MRGTREGECEDKGEAEVELCVVDNSLAEKDEEVARLKEQLASHHPSSGGPLRSLTPIGRRTWFRQLVNLVCEGGRLHQLSCSLERIVLMTGSLHYREPHGGMAGPQTSS